MDNFLNPRRHPNPHPAVGSRTSKIRYSPSNSATEDIASVWDDQRQIRTQDRLLEIEYELAKEKARRLKEQIKKNQIGDETIFGDDLKKYMPGYRPKAESSLRLAKNVLRAATDKAQRLKQQTVQKQASKQSAPTTYTMPQTGNSHTNQDQPIAHATSTIISQPKRRLKPLIVGIGCLIGISGISAGGFYVYKMRTSRTSGKTGVLSALVGDSSIVASMYYPSMFPEGYDPQAVTAARPEDAQEVYIITLRHRSDQTKSIYISQQPLPKDLDIGAFNDSLGDSREVFSVSAGTATAGTISADALNVVSIVNQNQWIIINGSTAVDLTTLKQVATSLEQ